MLTLTPRQQQLLDWLHEFMESQGFPPTRAEIARAFNFQSPNAAEEHLQALARKNAIELIPGASRGIRIKTLGLPVVGQVAAGVPLLAAEHIENYHAIDPGLFRPRADYFLKVRGMSMRDAGILHGDLLAVHRTPSARNGQIVVARLDDEVTVKRFKQRGNQVTLLAENADFPSLQIDLRKRELTIEGISVGLLRTRAYYNSQ